MSRLVLCALLAVTLAACGGGKPAAAPGGGGATSAAESTGEPGDGGDPTEGSPGTTGEDHASETAGETETDASETTGAGETDSDVEDGRSGGEAGRKAGRGKAASRDKPAATVTIVDFAFEPTEVTVAAGQSVRFAYDPAGKTIHNVTFPRGRSSESLGRGDRFDRTFAEPGTYDYLCTIHTPMKGTVVVEP